MSRFINLLFILPLVLAAFSNCQAQGKGFPIYVDISIKKSIAEFNFYTIYRDKRDGDEFAEVFIKQVAVTNPKLNKNEMKMIAAKRGIYYQVKVKQSKQKYTVSFLHTGITYEGVIEINPKVTGELRQIEFWRKSGEN